MTTPAQSSTAESGVGSHRATAPVTPSDLPYPVEELPTWADQLLPAGYRDAMVVSLFAPDRRQVGYLALLTDSEQSPLPQMRPVLAQVTAVLAYAIDPLRYLTTAAGLVQGARGGVVLHADGEIAPLPAHQLVRMIVLLAKGSSGPHVSTPNVQSVGRSAGRERRPN